MPTQAIQEAIQGVIVQISISLTPNRGVTVREVDSNARKVQIRIFFVSIVSRKTPKPCIFQFTKPQMSCFFWNTDNRYQLQILKNVEKHKKLDILNFSFKAILLCQSFFFRKYNSLKPPRICHKKPVFSSFFEIWVSLSMGNHIFQKMRICVLHLKTCDKIRKNRKIRFFEKTWK